MFKLFSNMLEAICSFISVLFIILSVAIGVIGGLALCDTIGVVSEGGKTALTIGIAIISAFLTFCINTLVFGLIANVVEIRKTLEEINAKKD